MLATFSNIPTIRYLAIYTLDDMPDSTIEVRYHMVNSREPGTERHTLIHMQEFIKVRFTTANMAAANYFDDMYVYGNTDCAIIFRDYIDSWIQEKAIQKRMGHWHGN